LVQTLNKGSLLVVVAQRNPQEENPSTLDALHTTGTFARVLEVSRPRGERAYRLVIEGVGRVEIQSLDQVDPFWVGQVRPLTENTSDAVQARVLAAALRQHATELASASGGSLGQLPPEEDPGKLADVVAASLGLSTDDEITVLSTLDVTERLRQVARLVHQTKELSDVRRKIDAEVRKGLNKGQREALLREQLRAIQRELGEGPQEDEAEALRERFSKIELPEEVRKVVDRELKRLAGMNPNQAEVHVIRNYLELIADLPWTERAPASDDLHRISERLDADHQGLDEVKKRILEHMAVLKLSGNPRGTILCFVGPPGVGKTSLGQSIADATGRPFVRIALGGVRDEAEIRGHRRTYVGALPGRILSALRKVKVRNPVVLLDEIDKLFSGWSGSPEAALLEVLDPEQNRTFTDHYLELPFDLSEVLFLTTANTLDTLSAPLRDRLEILELSGYTQDEKVKIARSHLIPRQLKQHGLTDGLLQVSDEALAAILREYTREAGVRQLTREIGKLCRALALQLGKSPDQKPQPLTVEAGDLRKYLGRPRFFSEVAERVQTPGVATGLAWTPVGGDILFIETSRMPGKGSLEITGQLGDVMKESARAALTYVRSNAKNLAIPQEAFEGHDLHIHVPAGATPKDGPSAGVTMFTALVSLLSGRKVRSDTAMTGEVTLRGRVMPVGGIKAKVLAAHRAGITRVILPKKNERDLEDIPENVRKELEFFPVEDMHEVLAQALEPASAQPAPVLPPSPPEETGSSRGAILAGAGSVLEARAADELAEQGGRRYVVRVDGDEAIQQAAQPEGGGVARVLPGDLQQVPLGVDLQHRGLVHQRGVEDRVRLRQEGEDVPALPVAHAGPPQDVVRGLVAAPVPVPDDPPQQPDVRGAHAGEPVEGEADHRVDEHLEELLPRENLPQQRRVQPVDPLDQQHVPGAELPEALAGPDGLEPEPSARQVPLAFQHEEHGGARVSLPDGGASGGDAGVFEVRLDAGPFFRGELGEEVRGRGERPGAHGEPPTTPNAPLGGVRARFSRRRPCGGGRSGRRGRRPWWSRRGAALAGRRGDRRGRWWVRWPPTPGRRRRRRSSS
jgi:ATP-dependent Lon protease